MSLIKIIANNIELDIVKETLTITKENNALIDEFKVSYSNFPFLIVENSKTIKALGGRDITTVRKLKIVPVIVEQLNEKYYGELQILSYLNGFRKVTLKFATELLTIMEKPISSFMPVISVIPGEVNPVPFSEESENVVPGFESWFGYVSSFKNESYPNVKFNFPMMYWKNKFGVDLQPDDDWIDYKQHINYFDDNGNYFPNYLSSIAGVITTSHKNVPAPQIYLLSPLFYALKSLGWTMEGDFSNSEFVKKIMILSTKNNLCKTTVSLETAILNYPSVPTWIASSVLFLHITYVTKIQYTLPLSGKYNFKWMYKVIDNDNSTFNSTVIKTFAEFVRSHEIGPFPVEKEKIRLFQTIYNGEKTYSGTHEFDGEAGDIITISYYNAYKRMPEDYMLSIQKTDQTKVFHQFHPTIELARYLPDWTFGTYLNEVKKLFNLKVDTDDFRKKISLNFNDDIIEISEKEVLKKSLAVKTYDQPLYNAFRLKFQNDIDTSLWIDADGIQNFSSQTSDFLSTLESKFKIVPNNGYTAELTENLESKDGVGLMIYNTLFFPYISSNYENQTLTMNGQKGIYESFWKKWLKFRLNAMPIDMTGYFTEMELSKIQKKQRVYIDSQDYLVASMEYSETEQNNLEALLKLESVNF